MKPNVITKDLITDRVSIDSKGGKTWQYVTSTLRDTQ